MTIKGVMYILHEVTYLRSVLKKYSGRMEKGEYSLRPNFRTLALKETGPLEFSEKYLKKPNESARMGYIASKFNGIKTFVNKNRKTTAEYDLIYTSNNNEKVREVKLFSSKEKKILVICTSPDEKIKQLSQYERFGGSYNMPKVKENNDYQNAFEISMVGLKEFPHESAALENICNSTVLATPSVATLEKVSAERLVDFSYNEEMNELLEKLRSKISKEVLDMEIPFCIQHGDISKENLLYGEADGKTDFWWIDWEHARERVFFYDLFFYIINSALYYDTAAYDLYMSGQADETLKAFFSHFGLSFDPEKRRDYLLIYMIDFLKERVCAFSRVSALRDYVEFIETH